MVGSKLLPPLPSCFQLAVLSLHVLSLHVLILHDCVTMSPTPHKLSSQKLFAALKATCVCSLQIRVIVKRRGQKL